MPKTIRGETKRIECLTRLQKFKIELELGPETMWECLDSPVGVCVYHPPSDPGFFDKCLFCGQPMERK